MTEFVVIVLAVLLAWKEYSSRKDRENYLDALMAKDANDLATIKKARKAKPAKPVKDPMADYVPIEEVDVNDKDFQEALKAER